MCTVTQKQIEEANERTMQRFKDGITNSDNVSGKGITISTEYNGKVFSRLVTWEEIEVAYGKALKLNGATI